MIGLEGMTERLAEIHRVGVAPTDVRAHDVAALYEILDDAVRRSFPDANQVGDLGEADVGILRDAHEHVAVVREECPRLRR